MKIMIVGSMHFAKEMLATKAKLESLGHDVFVPCDTDIHVEDPSLRMDSVRDKEHVMKNNIFRRCFDLLAQAEAILVLNIEQKGISGYIGTATLMEIGLAYYLKKKIFIMYPPTLSERYAGEVDVLECKIINGDLLSIL